MIIRAALSLTGALLLFLACGADATPRLTAHAWNDSLRPIVFAADTTALSWEGYPLQGVEGSLEPELEARWQPRLPQVDGDLDDWPLVRWQQVRRHTSVVRGDWSGPTDASLRFAILWNEEGILIGAEARDDRILQQPHDQGDPDSFFISFGTQSRGAQRWWRGADRTLQLWADGRVISTVFLRNRRRVLFDANVLGTRGAVRLGRDHRGRSGDAIVDGTLQAELFVPWTVLFPLLPHDALQGRINVLYEDVDPEGATLLGAATRIDPSGVMPSWARLSFRGSPPAGTMILSPATMHLEADVPLEWAVLRLSDPDAWTLNARVQDEALQVGCPPGPAIVRLHGAELPAHLWRQKRRLGIQLGADGIEHVFDLQAAPDAELLTGDLEDLDRLEANQDAEPAFPRVPDVYVRLRDVTRAVDVGLGRWHERRYHESGLAVWRASMWMLIEKRIADAELLRDRIVDPGAHAERWQRQFPFRTSRGVPTGQVVARGYRSELDGSVQPYALYVARRVLEQDAVVPLVLALHAIDKDEMEPFENTSLARQTEARGWIAVSPYGRGDTGFLHTGETDVLDVLDIVASDLPVDRRRLFVLGAGMGGTASWLLSLRHPDLFAGATVVSAFGDMDRQNFFELLGYHPREVFHFATMNPVRLLRAGIRTPYRIHHAEEDAVVPVEHARLMHRKLQEYGVPSEVVLDAGALHGEPLLERHIEAIFDWFQAQPPGSTGQPSRAWFGGSGGPLATVYPRGPFTVVYGTRPLPPGTPPVGQERRAGRSVTGPEADLRTAHQFALEWQAIYEGRVRLLPDTLVTPELQRQHNLVLIGDPRTNRVLGSIAADLPVAWSGDSFILSGHVYPFETNGVVFAAPHPRVEGRTVVVVSGMGERLGNFEKSLLKLGTDFIVTDDEHRFVDLGQFEGFVPSRPPQGGH